MYRSHAPAWERKQNIQNQQCDLAVISNHIPTRERGNDEENKSAMSITNHHQPSSTVTGTS